MPDPRWMWGAVVVLSGIAAAQPTKKAPPTRDEAQAKVDAAKVDVCEKGKRFLAEKKAKGTCAAEADEAAKVTCTPETSKRVTELMTACASVKPAQAVPRCRAVDAADASVVMAEAEEVSASKCTRLLLAKVKEARCGDAANKGKKLAFTVQFDHLVGTGAAAKKQKDGKQKLACPR